MHNTDDRPTVCAADCIFNLRVRPRRRNWVKSWRHRKVKNDVEKADWVQIWRNVKNDVEKADHWSRLSQKLTERAEWRGESRLSQKLTESAEWRGESRLSQKLTESAEWRGESRLSQKLTESAEWREESRRKVHDVEKSDWIKADGRAKSAEWREESRKNMWRKVLKSTESKADRKCIMAWRKPTTEADWVKTWQKVNYVVEKTDWVKADGRAEWRVESRPSQKLTKSANNYNVEEKPTESKADGKCK